jgi:CHASE2 domain-containing sensor protein/nitrogen-specific signal transduction histidine kinase
MNKKRKSKKGWLKNRGKILLCVLGVTGALAIVRTMGVLQPLEWAMYDWFFQIRPIEPVDARIIIVGLEETDIQRLKEWPVSDRNLARLLEKIKAQKPRIIGLDIYRDLPVEPGHEELTKVFQTTPNLIGVEQVSGDETKRIKPPPQLKEEEQVAASDLVVDSDGVLRRALLVPIEASKGENTIYNLGATVAILYLQDQGIFPHDSTSSFWKDRLGMQIGKVVFYPLRRNDGSYQNAKTGDYQFLINFRNPKQSFQKISFSEVLFGKIKPDLFRDKIVLIGSTAPSLKDEFLTPFRSSPLSANTRLHGVEIQAAIASHIVSAVLDGRPIIKVIPNSILESLLEYSLILGGGALTSVLIWQQRSTENYLILFLKIVGIVLIIVSFLLGGSYLAFWEGWWVSVVPSFIEVGGVSLITIGLILNYKNEELENLNQQLETTNQQLQVAQEQIIFERKQAALSKLVAGVAHEVSNPLTYIIQFAKLTIKGEKNLFQEIQSQFSNLSAESIEKIEEIKEFLQGNLEEVLTHAQRIDVIIKNLLRVVSSKSYKLTPVWVDINELVDSTLRIVTYSKQVKNNSFALNLEKNYDSTIGERKIVVDHLSEILINLIDNACDAVFKKKEREKEHFDPTIAVFTRLLDDNSLEITIQDNGDGISPKIAESIYEPFNTDKDPGKGTGLGLYLIYELIKINQGQIRWVMEAQKTSFVVTFPIYESDSEDLKVFSKTILPNAEN